MTSLVPFSSSLQTSPSQADTDAQVITLWLHGRGPNTREAYERDVTKFFDFVRKPMSEVTLKNTQDFQDSLTGAVSSQRRMIAAIKSLFSFAMKLGYIRFSVAAAIRAPKAMNTLAERILPESKIQKMFAIVPEGGREHLLLRMLYATGGRVSEICALKWRHLQENGNSGQITLFGKGGKTHAVLVSKPFWQDIIAFRGTAEDDAPVFVSRKKQGHLNRSQVWRIVQAVSKRAGIKGRVSPHWFRHAHASHALDRGAPIHLVSATLAHSSLNTTSAYVHAKPNESSSTFLAV